MSCKQNSNEQSMRDAEPAGDEIEGREIFRWSPPAEMRKNISDDIAQEYVITELAEACGGGVILWGKFSGKWMCNPWTPRSLPLRELLNRIAELEKGIAEAVEVIAEAVEVINDDPCRDSLQQLLETYQFPGAGKLIAESGNDKCRDCEERRLRFKAQERVAELIPGVKKKVASAAYPDWQQMRRDINLRIDCLEAAWNDLDDPFTDCIKDQLIIPAATKLAEFCAMVQVDESEE